MFLSLFFSSRRRLAAIWRASQRPLLPVLILLSCIPAWAGDRAVEKRVPPEYPVLARRMRIGGEVKVVATVAANGTVTAAKADHGNTMLAPAAEDAVRKWKFAAADAPSTEIVIVRFEIDQ